MQTDPAIQERLLLLADVDTRAVRVGHRRRTLPEDVALAEAVAELERREAAAAAGAATVAELRGAQAAMDAEVEAVRARLERNRGLLDTVRSAKELTGLTHETETLRARQGELEDAELEIMERLEEAESAQALLDEARSVASAAATAATADRDQAVAALAAEAGALEAERADAVAGMPVPLLALYDRVRGGTGDTGAALLTRGRCGGCNIELPGIALDEVRHAAADDVLQCEECRRILVRTAASGL